LRPQLNSGSSLVRIPLEEFEIYDTFYIPQQGACLSLLAVKVYYLTCPETTVGYAYYPETPTGAELTSVEKINGKCVDNALAVSEPYSLCKGEGTWAYPSGRCACIAGYEANEGSQTCNACPVGRFKHSSGEGPCHICPPHSQVTSI
jgi:ephrin-B